MLEKPPHAPLAVSHPPSARTERGWRTAPGVSAGDAWPHPHFRAYERWRTAPPGDAGGARALRQESSGCSARTRRVARCSAQNDSTGTVPHTSVTSVNGRSQRARRESMKALNRKIM